MRPLLPFVTLTLRFGCEGGKVQGEARGKEVWGFRVHTG
jgi:hypothetical protein